MILGLLVMIIEICCNVQMMLVVVKFVVLLCGILILCIQHFLIWVENVRFSGFWKLQIVCVYGEEWSWVEKSTAFFRIFCVQSFQEHKRLLMMLIELLSISCEWLFFFFMNKRLRNEFFEVERKWRSMLWISTSFRCSVEFDCYMELLWCVCLRFYELVNGLKCYENLLS